MKLCLSCYSVSKGGPYCGGCGRTFGVRLCGNGGHPNPPSSRLLCCTTCGSQDMTEPTRYANLGWIAPLLAGLVALAAWRWAVAHPALLAGLLWRTVLAAATLLLDTTPCGVVLGLGRAVAWLLELWLLGWLLALAPRKGGAIGSCLRALPATLFKLSFAGVRTVLRLLGSGLYRAVWPAKRRADPNGRPPRG